MKNLRLEKDKKIENNITKTVRKKNFKSLKLFFRLKKEND